MDPEGAEAALVGLALGVDLSGRGHGVQELSVALSDNQGEMQILG